MKLSNNRISRSILEGLLILLLVCVSVALIAASRDVDAKTRPVAAGLTVHEWGTFTSIAGNDGHALTWSPLDYALSDLPEFVEHFGWTQYKVGLRGTVRMETPVLYFYS